MSSKKRRIARKINQLVRMDATRSRMPAMGILAMIGMQDPAVRYWETCLKPLGKAISRRGHADKAMAALTVARENRVSSGGKP